MNIQSKSKSKEGSGFSEVIKLSIIMVNYHSVDLINKFEIMLRPCSQYELIVIDNSGDYARLDEITKLISPGSNVGFGKACNLGAKSASSDLLLFLNPDVILAISDIHALAKQWTGVEVAIWGPAILDSTSRTPTLVKPGRFGLIYRRAYISSTSIGSDIQSVLYVSGACMMIPKRYFDRIQGFSEDIFLYAEDLDLCQRASEIGASITVNKSIRIEHVGGRSSSKISSRFLRLYRSFCGHYIFLSKNNSYFVSVINALHLASGVRC